MKVNHLHLMVPDVPAAAGFFEKYFELRKANGNAGLTVLLDDGGFVLTLMKMGPNTNVTAEGAALKGAGGKSADKTAAADTPSPAAT